MEFVAFFFFNFLKNKQKILSMLETENSETIRGYSVDDTHANQR